MAHPLTGEKSGSLNLVNENTFDTSEYVSTQQSQNQPWPGVLTIGISQGHGFSIPEEYHQALNSMQSDPSSTQTDRPTRPWPVHRLQLLPYAIVEFDKSHVYAYAYATEGDVENPKWVARGVNRMRFDVFKAAELVLWLYLGNPSAPKGSRDFFLGKARIEPIFEEKKYTERLKVEGGTGEISVEIEYTKNKISEMQTFDRRSGTYLGKSRGSDYYHIYQAKRRDTDLLYACKMLEKADSSTHVFRSQADKPFIAPLKFVAQTSEGLQLNSPFIHGGPLFYHLQKPRCFDIDMSRFYAAEILCAFESLLHSNPSYQGPKTENILLDSIGHVVLCDFSLYSLETDQNARHAVEYPAPEQLLDQSSITEASVCWWWTLGVFLYEMLTGIPPFYAESVERMHERITSNEPIVYPDSLPPTAKDILTRLLNRDPAQRLGAKRGVAEIKEHPFFVSIDWDKLVRRGYHPAFKPSQITMPFREPRKEQTWAEIMEQFKGFKYNRPDPELRDPLLKELGVDTEQKAVSPPAPRPPPPLVVEASVEEKQEWELVWEEETKDFYFYNRSADAKQPIVPQTLVPRYTSARADGVAPAADARNLPSQIQKEAALEGMLKVGYTHLISQLLHEYGDMDVNATLYGLPGLPTALEYAAEHENTSLVKFLIEEGATDPYGSALFRTVREGHEELVTILAKIVDRVNCTRALGRAVDRQDINVINILLASGAKCDFEDADRPPPSDGCCFPEISENEDYMPPLVRAVRLGNMDLVRLLVERGADVNAGYHDLHGEHRFPPPSQVIDVTCGRVIQVAMELGHRDMVELFLDLGADIHLPQPVWHFHDCPMTPRAVYFRVAAGLREVEMERRLTRDSDEWVLV
ncbi:hypothetical protein V8C42DRAFT_312641 [Trichoderma barbatum]